MKTKKFIAGVLAGIMLTASMATTVSAYDIRTYYDSVYDNSLSDITSTIEWESGIYTKDNTNAMLPEATDGGIRTVLHYGKKQIRLKAADGYEFMVSEVVDNGGSYTYSRRYTTAFLIEFNTWMQEGYFNIYPDRKYLVSVRSKDGSAVSAANAMNYIRIYDVDLINHIPDYTMEHLRNKADTINNLQDAAGTFSFVFITDMHIQTNFKHSPAMIRFLKNQCGISTVIGGGDWATAWLGDADGIQGLYDDFNELRHLYKDLPLLKTIGNHEWGYGGNNQWNLTDAQAHNRFYRDSSAYDYDIKYGDEGKSYFYKDDPVYKMRYISLNIMDYPSEKNAPGYEGNKTMWFEFSQAQLDWLKNEALSLPDDEWTCMITSHVPVYFANEAPWNSMSAITNRDAVRAVVRNYINRENGFENAKGSFVGWLSGHDHADSMIVFDGFTQITTDGDTTRKADKWANDRKMGTYTEQCFDVFTVDKANKKVYVTRIGAGNDRSFIYR